MTIPALQISDLTKDFGGLRAVDGISFQVEQGEFVGLIGPNGCGKTTTFNCISGLLQITSGKINILGKDATGMRPDQIQSLGLTRTFQHTWLWREMTVIENLLVPPRHQFSPNPFLALLRPKSRKAETQRLIDAYSVLDVLEISHIAHHLTSELSGGQSKLVDIGRALMSSPSFLLLDEPVAGVAGPLAERIFQNLRTLTSDRNIGMLVIEHNMDFILRRDVDRIIVMDGGQILMEGTPNEIKQSRDVVEAYLGNPGGMQE
ncbi:MAG: ABC transporter ATP-binding protein [SAR202 cluster bacterium]|nr:ABC transporter ATP-binding protein [SAR202 cluster bacterium]|tara:strand:- start:274 stop:1056 length:783 start_codon:yes stop_codon:yes gene_type:complete